MRVEAKEDTANLVNSAYAVVKMFDATVGSHGDTDYSFNSFILHLLSPHTGRKKYTNHSIPETHFRVERDPITQTLISDFYLTPLDQRGKDKPLNYKYTKKLSTSLLYAPGGVDYFSNPKWMARVGLIFNTAKVHKKSGKYIFTKNIYSYLKITRPKEFGVLPDCYNCFTELTTLQQQYVNEYTNPTGAFPKPHTELLFGLCKEALAGIFIQDNLISIRLNALYRQQQVLKLLNISLPIFIDSGRTKVSFPDCFMDHYTATQQWLDMLTLISRCYVGRIINSLAANMRTVSSKLLELIDFDLLPTLNDSPDQFLAAFKSTFTLAKGYDDLTTKLMLLFLIEALLAKKSVECENHLQKMVDFCISYTTQQNTIFLLSIITTCFNYQRTDILFEKILTKFSDPFTLTIPWPNARSQTTIPLATVLMQSTNFPLITSSLNIYFNRINDSMSAESIAFGTAIFAHAPNDSCALNLFKVNFVMLSLIASGQVQPSALDNVSITGNYTAGLIALCQSLLDLLASGDLTANDKTVIDTALEHNAINFLLSKLAGPTPLASLLLMLCFAVNANQESIALLLSQQQLDITTQDHNGCGLLHYACLTGDIQKVETLLKIMPLTISTSWTPLHSAAFKGHWHIINYLVEQGFRLQSDPIKLIVLGAHQSGKSTVEISQLIITSYHNLNAWISDYQSAQEQSSAKRNPALFTFSTPTTTGPDSASSVQLLPAKQ